MSTPYEAWYATLGVLYLMLSGGAMYRLVLKCSSDGNRIVKKTAIVLFIYVSLVCYGLCRAVVLILTAADKVPDNQSLSQSMFDAIPALLFSLLQTFLIAKWAGHVNDITFVLNSRPFRWKRPILALSVGCFVGSVIATVVVIADQSASDTRVSPSSWNRVLNIASGITYTLNGALFAGLGVALRSEWHPSSESDIAACRRILAIAVLFGGVCIVRGVALLVFVSRDKATTTLVTSHWSTPLILNIEWIALVTSLFGLTNVGGSASSAGSAAVSGQADPMIASSTRTFGSSRRVPFGWRSNSASGHQLNHLAPSKGGGGYPEDGGNQRVDNQSPTDIPSEGNSTASMTINDAGE